MSDETNSAARHTPGPWRVAGQITQHQWSIVGPTQPPQALAAAYVLARDAISKAEGRK